MAHAAPFVGREQDVARLVDWVAGSPTPGALVVGDPGAGKSRLVREAAARAASGAGLDVLVARATAAQSPALGQLARMAATRPTVLVLEDLHRLGEDGLEVLGELLRAPVAGVRLVATARTGERSVERWTARAVRDGVLEVLALGGLRKREVAVLLGQQLGRRPSREEVERAAHLSGGNPRWVEELVRSGATGGDRLPPQLVDAVAEQWRDLSPPARAVVQAAAAAGGDLTHALLAAVVPDRELDQGCREAVDAGVLEVSADGHGYRFRSELVRVACYDRLLPAEREALHRRWAVALTGAADRDLAGLAQLARHWVEAGDPARALHWSLAAAREAERRTDHGRALSSYQQALALWTAGTPHRRADVLRRAARAATRTGEHATALQLVEQALALVDPVAEPVAAARLEERRGWLLGAAHPVGGRRAVELLAGAPASREQARALATHGLLLALRGQPAEALRPAEEALAVARRLGAVAEQAAALIALGTARALSTDRAGGDRLLRRGCELARSVADVDDLLVGYPLLLETRLLHEADLTPVAQLAAVAGEALRGLGADPPATRLCAAAAHHELGQWELAAGEARAASRSPAGRLLLTLVAAVRGEPAPGLRQSGPGEGGCVLPGLEALLQGSWLAELQLLQGAAARAAGTVERALSQPALRAEPARWGPLLVLGLRAQADRATAGWDTGDGGLVRDAQEQGAALAARAGFGSGPVEQALAASWAGEQSRLAGAPDPDAWAAAAAAWSALSRWPRAAYARWRQAEALLADRAHRRLAGPVATEALELAHRLGAAPLRREVELLVRQAHLPLPLQRAEPEPAPAAGPVLTRRERDVLELLSEGLSNRAIAAALVVSPKTVDTHVAHLLMKLDVHDRVAAAGRAQRLGLLQR